MASPNPMVQAVTKIGEADKKLHDFDIAIPGNASFAVNSSSNAVTETLTRDSATATPQYAADPSNASLYHIAQQSLTISNPSTPFGTGYAHGYSFTISGSQLIALI